MQVPARNAAKLDILPSSVSTCFRAKISRSCVSVFVSVPVPVSVSVSVSVTVRACVRACVHSPAEK